MWKISAIMRTASRMDGAPTGMIMNSWKSTELSACAPPLMMFAIGHGHEGGVVGAQVLEQGHAEEVRGRPRGGHGDAEDGVGAELGLGLGPVQLDHGMVDVDLLQRVQPHDLGGDDVVHVLHRLEHALAEETGLVPVAQLQRLVLAGRCSRRHRRPAHATRLPGQRRPRQSGFPGSRGFPCASTYSMMLMTDFLLFAQVCR